MNMAEFDFTASDKPCVPLLGFLPGHWGPPSLILWEKKATWWEGMGPPWKASLGPAHLHVQSGCFWIDVRGRGFRGISHIGWPRRSPAYVQANPACCFSGQAHCGSYFPVLFSCWRNTTPPPTSSPHCIATRTPLACSPLYPRDSTLPCSGMSCAFL